VLSETNNKGKRKKGKGKSDVVQRARRNLRLSRLNECNAERSELTGEQTPKLIKGKLNASPVV
jgi:hypothetical protein